MSVTARHLVGREEELGAILRLLDAPEQLPGVAVLAGEAGAGKTTLWLAGTEAATDRGYLVLSCRPSEAETRFSFAGLTDLLGGVAEILPRLPPIQRRALDAAMLLGESEGRTDERAVAAAFLGALRLLAVDSPLLLAVDDIQWLDAASLAALRFALARLDREPVGVLLAIRSEVAPWLRRAVPPDRLQTIEVGSLSVGAIHELLRAGLGAKFSRPILIRIWETSGGNPFFALELASALQRRGGMLAPGEELPIPANLDALLRERLDGLSAPALEIARVVAALAEPTVTLVESAVGRRFDAGLAAALTAHILELKGNACDSPIHSSDLRSLHAGRRRADDRSTLGSRPSSRPLRSEPATSLSLRTYRIPRSPRPSRARRGRRRHAAPPRRPPSWRSRRSGSRRVQTSRMRDDVFSSPPTRTTSPATSAVQ